MIAAVSLSGPSKLDHARPVEGPTIEILVAQRSLNVGDLIRHPETQFAKKRIRQADAPEGAITSFADLTDRILKHSLRKGDHITQHGLYGVNECLEFPQDCCAFALRLDKKTLPCQEGNRVDIWPVLHLPNDTEVKSMILRNVLVVVGSCGRMEPDAESVVVTFAIHGDDIPKFESATATGRSFRITLPSPP